jgi:hypothetical protein
MMTERGQKLLSPKTGMITRRLSGTNTGRDALLPAISEPSEIQNVARAFALHLSCIAGNLSR